MCVKIKIGHPEQNNFQYYIYINIIQVKLSDMPSMKLAEMEPMIKMFSSLTNTNTAEEIPTAYKRQIQNHKQLVEISEKMKVKLDQALEKHDQLEKNLEDQRYHQTQQTLEGNKNV